MQKLIVWLGLALAEDLHYVFSCLAEICLGVLCTYEKEDKKLRKGCRSGWGMAISCYCFLFNITNGLNTGGKIPAEKCPHC